MSVLQTRTRVPTFGPERRTDSLSFRTTVVVLLATFLIAVAVVIVPGTVGPGLGILIVGGGVGLVYSGLNSPTFAVVMLLVALFLRDALQLEELPAELYLFAFAGVLGASWLALTRGTDLVPQVGAVEAAMALYLVWSIGSIFLPHTYPEDKLSPAYSFILTSTVLPFALYMFGRFVLARERAVRVLLWTVVGLAAYSTLVSILQFHAPALVWPRYIVELDPSETNWADRAVGVFSQPVVNGLLLVIGFLVAMHLAHQPGTRGWQRTVLYVLSLVSLYAIYLTHTRVVWLIFLIAVALAAALLPRSRPTYVSLIVAMVMVAAVNWQILTSDDRTAGGVTSTEEVDDRLNIIITGWWAVQEQPVVGWGITRFAQVNTYHHMRWSSEVDWIRGYGAVSHLHELGIAAELGLVGLGLWLAVIALVARRLWRAPAALPRDGLCGRDLAVVASIVFVIWIITGWTADIRFFSFANTLVLLMVGVVIGIADRRALTPAPAVPEPRDELDELLGYAAPSAPAPARPARR